MTQTHLSSAFSLDVAFLLFAALLFGGTEAGNIMTVNNNPITPTSSILGGVGTLYVNSTADLFIVISGNGIYSLDTATYQTILEQYPIAGAVQGYLYTELAGSHGYLFAMDTNSLFRFNMFNVSETPTVYAAPISGFQVAIDTNTNFGFLVSQNDANIDVVDLLTMTHVTSFTYNYTFPNFPLAGGPSGFTIFVDTSRSLLYVAVDCNTPSPTYIWQFDISDIQKVNLTNKRLFSSATCFISGFAELADGRAWMADNGGGWAGGFDVADLSYGSEYTIPSATPINYLVNLPSEHMSFWVDGTPSDMGRVYRVCNLEDSSSRLKELVTWNIGWAATAYVQGVYFDPTNRKLYISANPTGIWTITVVDVGTTDCQQVPTNPPPPAPCASPASRLSPFFFLW